MRITTQNHDREPLLPAPPQNGRMLVTALVFGGLFAALVVRLTELQIERSDALKAKVTEQVATRLVTPAPRGSILDRDGTPMAMSLSRWTLKADTGYMVDKLRATVLLSEALGMPREELRAHFESNKNGRIISRHLSEEQAQAVKALKLDHLVLEPSFQRIYSQGAMAAHVVGFLGDDGAGLGGIEQSLDRQLAGTPGEIWLTKDALGRYVMSGNDRRIETRPGAHIQLTLVSALQLELEAALAEAVQKHQAANACGIMVRPATGEVLAMASLPTFDPNTFREDFVAHPDRFRNHALAFVYESGSTIKPLIAAGAVADGLVRWNSQIDCENGHFSLTVGRHSRPIHGHPHGILSLNEVIAKSDNIAMVKVACMLGPQRLHDWIVRWGFGSRTGIELPGENLGIKRSREKWDVLNSCGSVSRGYELAVTPIQMAMAHAAIANRGVWNPPRLVRRVFTIDEEGRPHDLEAPAGPSARRVLSEGEAEGVAAAMRGTMTDGTGNDIPIEGYVAAGKTGTTEKLVNGHYSGDRHIGSFVCWAPASPGRQPEVLCLVLVDDPRTGGFFGAVTAGPAVQRAMSFALKYLQVAPDAPVEEATETPPRGAGRRGAGRQR